MPKSKMNTMSRRVKAVGHQNSQLTDIIVGKMKNLHVTQKAIGELCGRSQQSISMVLKEERLTASDLIAIYDALDFTDEEIIRSLRI